MERAISLGVFCRLAPSISSIMRSMNDSPGLAVTRTVIRSESTVVPPVTEERSLPASRTTGADSPVMADSSMVAAPSMISPSAAMTSPAWTTKMSSLAERFRGDHGGAAARQELLGVGLGAALAERVGLGLAAAFGHGLGEVGEQHREPQPDGDLQRRTPSRSAVAKNRSSVVTAAPTSVTNITGFFTMWTGLSLRKLSKIAGTTISRSNRGRALADIYFL